MIRCSGLVPNSRSPAKPASSKVAGGLKMLFGRPAGRRTSGLTFLGYCNSSILSVSLCLSIAPSDSVNDMRFSADGTVHDPPGSGAAEQLNQARTRMGCAATSSQLTLAPADLRLRASFADELAVSNNDLSVQGRAWLSLKGRQHIGKVGLL